METEKLWDETVILITSDHEWRHVYLYDNIRVRKVPFLIKMGNQHEMIVYDESFSPMLITKDFLLEILSNRLKDADAVVRWLNHQKSE